MKATKTAKFKKFVKYEKEFREAMAALVEDAMHRGGEDFGIRGAVLGKVLCDALVVHLTTLFHGDMSAVTEFISRGVNIDVRVMQHLNKRRGL